MNFTTGLIGGLFAGLALGVASTMTDDKRRRSMMRDSKRALKKAGHFIDDIKSAF